MCNGSTLSFSKLVTAAAAVKLLCRHANEILYIDSIILSFYMHIAHSGALQILLKHIVFIIRARKKIKCINFQWMDEIDAANAHTYTHFDTCFMVKAHSRRNKLIGGFRKMKTIFIYSSVFFWRAGSVIKISPSS